MSLHVPRVKSPPGFFQNDHSYRLSQISAHRGPQMQKPLQSIDLMMSSPVPEELLPSVLLAVQADASVKYAIRSSEESLLADNPAHQFNIRFMLDGTYFTPYSGEWIWEMHLLGYGGARDAIERLPQIAPTASDNRVEYRYPALTEWYLNGPLGLEQCFTIYCPPDNTESQDIVLELSCAGNLHPKWDSHHQAIVLLDPHSKAVLSYRQLHVVDANNRMLPARFDISWRDNEAHIFITIDASQAVYPILVDPIIGGSKNLAASDGMSNDNFGFAVAISGNTVVVGAPQADTGYGANAGAAYVFVRTKTGSWTQHKLIASDGTANAHFGHSVAIQDNTIIVGTPDAGPGAVYVFVKTGTTWSQQAKLTASNGAVGDKFGFSVAIDSNTLVAGAPDVSHAGYSGTIYIFVRNGTTWSQQASFYYGEFGDDNFGYSVGIAGNRVVIGAKGYDDVQAIHQGLAFVYERSGSTWTQRKKIQLTSGQYEDDFGRSVAISPNGNYVIVGCPYRDTVKGTNAGAAYIFFFNGDDWVLQKELLPNSGSANDLFGYSVAIHNSAAIVGTPYHNTNKGIVCYFVRRGSDWVLVEEKAAPAAVAGDNYGAALAMDSHTALIGAPGRTSGKGQVFIFIPGPGEPWNKKPDSHLGTCDFGEPSTKEPISLYHGEKREQITDIALNSPAGLLPLTRTYLQNEHSTYQFMGLGWTHNHRTSLSLIIGSPATIIIRWDNGGEGYYTETSPDHFEGVDGITSFVDRNSSTGIYTLVLADKSTIVFDASGKIVSRSWPSGEAWTYAYDGNQIAEVSDDYGRRLVFRYYNGGDFDGQLYRVGDQTFDDTNPSSPTGRYVEYGYSLNRIVNASGEIADGTNALLTSVRDVNSKTWTYTYYGHDVDETDVRQLNYLIKLETPAVDTTGDGTADSPITVKQLTYTMQATELAVNGGMEVNGNWPSILNALPTMNAWSTTQVDTGTHSRRVVTNAANRGIEGEPWNLIHDRIYIVTARVYPVSGTVKMQVTGQTDFDRISSGTDTWETLRAVYKATADATGRKLQFIASGGAAEFYVDTVSIIESDLSITTIVQSRGDDAMSTAYSFQPDLDLTTETIAGKTTYHWFNDGVYLGQEDPAGNLSGRYLNSVYRPESVIDSNSNESLMTWSEDGKLLNSATDPAGRQMSFSYNASGAAIDTLDETTDAEQRVTKYIYGDPNNPRLYTEVKVFDVDGVTVLRWQKFTYDSKGRTLTEQTVDPTDGTTVLQRTTRTYYTSGNGNGLLHTLTQEDIGDVNNTTTTYHYDSIGRVVKTQRNSTFGSCEISYTVYDASGKVVASICNYDPGTNPDPTTTAEAAALFDPVHPEKNRVTAYEYDAAGRRVSITTDAGADYAVTTVTVYDGLDRVVRTISNYVPDAAIPNPYIAVHSAFDHGDEQNQNLVTDTVYNQRGLVRAQVDVFGNVTLYGYDDAGWLIKTIQNASQPAYNNDYGGTSPDPSLTNYVVNTDADQDIVTTQSYDPNGNLVQSVDVFGSVTYTVYDVLNRPIKTIRHAKEIATLDLNPDDADYDATNDPRASQYVASSDPARDIIETTEYDIMGRVKRTQDALGNWTLYGYDPLGRQVRTIRNASDPGYAATADLSGYSAGSANDQDLITDTVYDAQGRVLYTADLTSEKTWLAYDGLGRQVKTIVNAVGTATDGGVNDPRSSSYVESSEADRDLITRTTYDMSGRVRWTQDPSGRKTWYVYDEVGRQKKVIQICTYTSGTPAPEEDTYVGQHAADSAKDVITQTVYDAQGRIATTIDSRGNETRYTYDVLGRRTQVITNYIDGVYDADFPDEDLIQTMIYDLTGRLANSVDNAGNETRYEYDALGRRTKTIVNYDDGVYSAAQPDVDLISTTTYNKGGQVVSTADARGTMTSFAYDAAGRRLTVTQAANTPLATTSYTCYDKGGRVLRSIQNYVPDAQETSPDAKDMGGNFLFAPPTHGLNNDQNLITTYTLDRLGRQVAVTDAVGNQALTEYRKDGQVLSATDAEEMVSAYRYDRLRRRTTVVQSYQANGEDPGLWVWDVTDNRWEKSGGAAIVHGTNNDQNIIVRSTYDKTGRMLTLRDPRGNLIGYEYDLLNRRTKLTNPLSQGWVTAYADVLDSGSPTGETQITTIYPGLSSGGSYDVIRQMDRLGRLASIDYGAPTTTPAVTFAYDAAGNRVKMSESDGTSTVRETNYSYDQARRLTSVGFDEDGSGTVEQTVSYEYDAGGLRTKLTLPGDLDITYVYDAKGQLVSLSDWDNQATRFAYDNVRRLRLVERPNRMRSLYQYDAGGRLKRLRHRADGKTFGDFLYKVDRRGNRTGATEFLRHTGSGSTTIDKDDAVVEYALGTWTDSGAFKVSGNISARLSLAFAGDEVTLTMGTGPDHSLYDIYIDHSYWDSIDGYAAAAGEREIDINLTDDGFHTLEIRNRAERNAASSGYKVRFKTLEVNRQYDLHTWGYDYDALARLLTANLYPGTNGSTTPARAYTYAFDQAGNRLSESLSLNGAAPMVTSYTYNAANQISSSGFTYDANGNLTSDGTNTYVWDRANRLLSTGGVSYAYDGAGNRIERTVGMDVTKYLLDLQPSLATVLQMTQGANTTRYVHAPRGIHAQQDASDNWEWLFQDGLGSVRSVADDTFNVLWTGNPQPFGIYFGESGTRQSPYLFTGEYTDPLTELLHLRARDYNPALGVFPSLDPFEGKTCTPMSLNRYSWVEGNTVNATDPSGLYKDLADTLSKAMCKPAEQQRDCSTCTLPWERGFCEIFGSAPCPPVGTPTPTPPLTPTPLPSPTPTPTPRPRITAGLGNIANTSAPIISDCSTFAGAELQACETLRSIQGNWGISGFSSGPNYGELVALAVATEWYNNRGDSGNNCSGLPLGAVASEATARQFWYWYSRGSSTFIVNFLTYFQPIREQRLWAGADLFTSTQGVQGLLQGASPYIDGDMRSIIDSIFNNTAWQFSLSHPGAAESNCPYGWANRTNRTTESYADTDALYISGDYAIVSFAQNYDSQIPRTTPCTTFDQVRSNAGCGVLGGLPSPTPTPSP